MVHLVLLIAMLVGVIGTGPASASDEGPFSAQVNRLLSAIDSPNVQTRAGAAESLGFMRVMCAEKPLIARLADESSRVRREAALALAWCGTRDAIPHLLAALDDDDWLVRQSAQVALTNLTGMELPLDAIAVPSVRGPQRDAWREWYDEVSKTPKGQTPQYLLAMLGMAEPPIVDDVPTEPTTINTGSFFAGATASTTYKGPPSVLFDGKIGPEYWQTKNVAPPQSLTIELGQPREISWVVVHQYNDLFVMTGYDLELSEDGKEFKTVASGRERTAVALKIEFPKQTAKHIRITSHGSLNPTYPTTFYEVEVDGQPFRPIQGVAVTPGASQYTPEPWREERALRALGTFGGDAAVATIIAKLGPSPTTDASQRLAVRAGIRSLGRLGGEQSLAYLVSLLENPFWARHAAEALGDIGDQRAVFPLITAYARYAKTIDGDNPPEVPRDDRMGFPSEDRMLETPYLIAQTLCRLPLDKIEDRAGLREIGPQIMANLPCDHDALFLYELEVGHLMTRHLLDIAGLKDEACEQAFKLCQSQQVASGEGRGARLSPKPPEEATEEADENALVWSNFSPRRAATWLPCVCDDPKYIPRLIPLLDHPDGWVSLNAAKTLALIGDRIAIEPIAIRLRDWPNEASYGMSGTFKDEEYNDPAPRRREGVTRALGILGAVEHVDMLINVLEDEDSVLECRFAAAQALGDLGEKGGEKATAALKKAALEHAFLSVRHIARDALLTRGIHVPPPPPPRDFASPPIPRLRVESAKSPRSLANIDAIVFIKGSNDIPNTKGTVEQADRWRQTYAVTDSGPAYRPGRNLYILSPPRLDGTVTPLTRFEDGYVAELEVSWDGSHVIFSRRGENDPWWHIWRVNIDGTGLMQITSGNYHYVGPNYLPDGRIVCASTRLGIRDEYHGYPCTGLWAMNPDGSDQQPLATNIGRDNEPAVLNDGRIVFSRLEVFYSRNKTELTLHAAYPDGTRDMVLYGPERRVFWRNLDHGPRTPADGQEAPLTHRVLRMTQPQPMPDGKIIVATQGGLTLIGSRRDEETIITPDNKTRAYTTPFPLPDGTVLCAVTEKTPDRSLVDLGLYLFDPATGSVDLVYNDSAAADFEARPIMARTPPPVRPSATYPGAYSGQMICTTVFATQEPGVTQRGRLVRLIEGVPAPARHSTQTNPEPVWKNHGGTFARVLGTVPLAPDGSFNVEVPADRLLHFQVLDSNRQVVGNQLTWIYARPGERKACIGCHEPPHSTTRANNPLASHYPPVQFLPSGDEFTYRAKAWFKGHLPDEIEERQRTARSVNLFGR